MSNQAEEVRLAMGWNGGVSLAVWMGGVAVELDCARRADLSPEGDTEPPRRIYNAICDAFQRKLVLDIFAGASAGGLNSALLGAAIFRRRRLHPDFLRDKWLSIGDFSKLLQPTNQAKPTSVMQGDLFARSVVAAFKALMNAAPNPTTKNPDLCSLPKGQAALASARPLLDIQATNVVGQQHGFIDAWGRRMYAREYRAPFRFRTDSQFTPELLAAAARSSASFPGAFEPSLIEGAALAVAGLAGDQEETRSWDMSVGEQPAVLRRYAIDGGVLENAPIRQAIALIPLRPASGPVKRFVCYVNANASHYVEDKPDPKPPSLRDVLGYVVNLPRIGRDIDQLNAIVAARRRGEANAETLAALLAVPHDDLVATASGLFPPYRKRRAYRSVEDILSSDISPAKVEIVEKVMDNTHDGALFPWLPPAFSVPQTAAQWNWGFRAAQRVLYLQLDVLASAFKASRGTANANAVSDAVFAGRGPIDDAIQSIGSSYRDFVEYPGVKPGVARLAQIVDPAETTSDASAAQDNALLEAMNVLGATYENFRDDDIFQTLNVATKQFYETALQLQQLAVLPEFATLFGEPQGNPPVSLQPKQFEHFLGRALAIEVIRRAFSDDADIDAAQTLNFTQLAPNAAVRIFTRTPLSATGPAEGEEKLTGIRLAHFAGFYRRSWRANDFMWGRLDAATRIVDFLVDQDWRDRLDTDATPWMSLSLALVPDGGGADGADQRKLVREALLDGQEEASELAPAVSELLSSQDIPSADATQAGQLRDCAAAAMKADLTAEPAITRGFLTRVLLSRAAQYEILRQELPVLVRETKRDDELGCASAPLDWNLDGSLMETIKKLRTASGKNSLPNQLGRDSGDEAASTLALRTVAHTALVALAALPGVSMPLSRITTPGRIPFLSVAGVVGRSIVANVAVLVSFAAAAFYISARIITADNHNQAEGKHAVLLGEIISPPVLTMGLAMLVVIGVLLVPAWRAFRSSKHLSSAAWGISLLACGGGVAVAAGLIEVGRAQTLTGSGGFKPSNLALAIVFVCAGIGVAAARQLPLLGKLVEKFREARTWATSVISIAAAGVILVYSSPHVVHALSDGSIWHFAAALSAIFAAPVLAAYAYASGWWIALRKKLA